MNDLTQSQEENLLLACLRLQAHARAERGGKFVTERELAVALKSVLDRAQRRQAETSNGGRPNYSFSRMIRGLSARKGLVLNARSVEGDLAYCRALSSGTSPGSLLVPTIQANAIVSGLTQYNSARASGARIWPVMGVENLTVPLVAAQAAFYWTAENSQITVSDQNYGQLSFVMKNLNALLRMSYQLFAASVPSFDVLMEDSVAFGLAEAEDLAMHASTTVALGPVALMSAAGITIVNANNANANGGNLLYGDLTGALAKAVTLKMRPPLVWFGAGQSWLRILNLASTTSQPLINVGEPDSPLAWGKLFNFDFFSAGIPTNEAVGSGSNQSHIILTSPRSIHIAEDGRVEVAVATDSPGLFESNQVEIRIARRVAFAYSPAASIIALQGIS